MARRFDFDAALTDAEPDRPIPGKRLSELQHPQIHEWIGKCYERQREGKITWVLARELLQRACKENGLRPLKSSSQVIAAYARRKFGNG